VCAAGNVSSYADALDALATTRCDGVMSAEELLRDPALFARCDLAVRRRPARDGLADKAAEAPAVAAAAAPGVAEAAAEAAAAEAAAAACADGGADEAMARVPDAIHLADECRPPWSDRTAPQHTAHLATSLQARVTRVALVRPVVGAH
jgi:tRNA-dihydrouridine synthase